MRVGIDLDGVCYDFAASVREYLMLMGERTASECPPATRWEFYEDWGLSLAEFLRVCHRGVDAGVIFSYGQPFDGTREELVRLKNDGHTLHIVTDRSFGTSGAAEAATRAWLDRHELPFDSLTFSPDKTVVRLDTMIDDKLANYDALYEAGVDVRLFNRPWNRVEEFGDFRLRVNSMGEFAYLAVNGVLSRADA